ncbi:MAG: endolytic transglycosylase MltG [Zetaproteobacteria bacterium]|nr:MAG: endolytic transglycosylase MltG [Zetaproteobacteria bacterium]
MKRRALAGMVLLLLSIAVGCWWWLVHWLDTPRRLAVERFTVPPGMSERGVAAALARAGVIDHPLALRLYLRLHGGGRALQAGSYRFVGALSPRMVVERLRRGAVLRLQVTVPEGLRSAQIIALLARRTGVEEARWRQAWRRLGLGEGELLPESWRYTLPLDPYALLARMRAAQRRLLARLDPDRRHWPRLRIIASIIEKETARERERPLISAVIHNRLARGMPLQMDPTVIYGIYRRDGRFSGDLTRRDLRRDTPWNSYLHKGLPPTPICHPGRASLIAAARPAKSDALYFVADGRGGHRFAATLAGHRRNVARYLATLAAARRRGGGGGGALEGGER